MVEVGVAVAVAPDALWGQRGSGGGRGADHAIVCDGTEFDSGTTAGGDGKVETVVGWRTGLVSVVGVVGREVEKWSEEVGGAGVAGKWIEGAAACEVDEEGV